MTHDPLCRLRKEERCSGIGGVDWGHYLDQPVCRNCGALCTCDAVREARAAIGEGIGSQAVAAAERFVEEVQALCAPFQLDQDESVESGADDTITDRGFRHAPERPGAYGGEIKVYESSAASAPHVWIGIVDDVEATIHLTVEDALKFATDIQRICTLHYQLREDS